MSTDLIRDQSLERSLPNSAEAERAILGGVILENHLISQVMQFLQAENFYIPSHRRILVAMINLVGRDVEINAITIAEELKKEGSLESVGGVSFITNLTYGLPHSTNIVHYARIVKKKAMLRDLIKISNRITQDALAEEDEPDVIQERAESLIISNSRVYAESDKRGARSYRQIAEEAKKEMALWRAGKTTALRSGIPELDALLKFNGFAKQDLIYIGARASVGKTAFVLDLARNISMRGHKILIFSLEMDEIALFFRTLSATARVENWKIRPDMFEHADTVDEIGKVFQQVADSPIFVDDSTHDLSHIVQVSRDFVRRLNGELIVVDYQQLVSGTKQKRHEEVAEVSKELKRLAKTLDVPLIATTQLARGIEGRPEIEHLRESGQLEQDADLILFPYQLEKNDDKDIRTMSLYCPKQRNGKRGWEIPMDFWAHQQRFYTKQMLADEMLDDARAERQIELLERQAISEESLVTDKPLTFDGFDEQDYSGEDRERRDDD